MGTEIFQSGDYRAKIDDVRRRLGLWKLVRQKAYRKTFELACSRLADLPLEERAEKAGLGLREEGGRSLTFPYPFSTRPSSLPSPAFPSRARKGPISRSRRRSSFSTTLSTPPGAPVGAGPRALRGYPRLPRLPACIRAARGEAPAARLRLFQGRLSAAGKALGGKEEEYGNASFTLPAFPRLPITFILWEGDEDFPPSIKVLFDRSIHTYLPLEDIVVVSKMAATRMLKEARKKAEW